MAIDFDKKFLKDHARIEDLQTDYLREITSLSKIFITLSIAILGLSMSQSSPGLSNKIGLIWIVSTWISLILSAMFGFLEIFFFSRRFKKNADYIQSSLLVDMIVRIDNSEKKLTEFIGKSEHEKQKFARHYKLCNVFVVCQAVLLLIAFVFWGIFINKNI